MLCLLIFLSWSYVPIKNGWIKSYWIVLPIPPCNLGIISVIPYGNLSISEYSGWKGFRLEKIRTLWNNISNAKIFLWECLSLVLYCLTSQPKVVPSWQLSSKSECFITLGNVWYSLGRSDIIFWNDLIFVWKRVLILQNDPRWFLIVDWSLGKNLRHLNFPFAPIFLHCLFLVPLDMEGVLLMDLWLFNPQTDARLALEGWIGFSEFRIVWWCSGL